MKTVAVLALVLLFVATAMSTGHLLDRLRYGDCNRWGGHRWSYGGEYGDPWSHGGRYNYDDDWYPGHHGYGYGYRQPNYLKGKLCHMLCKGQNRPRDWWN